MSQQVDGIPHYLCGFPSIFNCVKRFIDSFFKPCIWVMMNTDSRRLSKIPEEVRQELEPHFLERVKIVDKDTQKISKLDENTADYICKGLAPRRSDFDVNQHVNNVKYISWILECISRPHGVCYMAGKTILWSGGGTRQFLHIVNEDACKEVHEVKTSPFM